MMEIGCGLAGVVTVLAIMSGVLDLLIQHHAGRLVPFWLSCFWWPCAVLNFWEARTESGHSRAERAASYLRGLGPLVLCASFFAPTWPDALPGFLVSFPMIFIIPQIVERIFERRKKP